MSNKNYKKSKGSLTAGVVDLYGRSGITATGVAAKTAQPATGSKLERLGTGLYRVALDNPYTELLYFEGLILSGGRGPTTSPVNPGGATNFSFYLSGTNLRTTQDVTASAGSTTAFMSQSVDFYAVSGSTSAATDLPGGSTFFWHLTLKDSGV